MSSVLPGKRKAEFISEESCVPDRKVKGKAKPVSIKGVKIQPMNADQISEVGKICLEGLLEYCENNEQRQATESHHHKLEARISNQLQRDCDEGFKQYNRKIWVAVQGAKVLGCVGIKPRMYKKLDDHSSVEVYKVSVVPGYRGTGLAQKLLKAAETHCKEQKIGAMHLTTQDNLTRAISFYEKEGYTRTHEKKWESYLLYYYRKVLE